MSERVNMMATRAEPTGLRISVQLDPGMLVEHLVLQNLNALPKRRHRDWIRSLLVQGYLAERRVFRRLSEDEANPQSGARSGPGSRRSGFAFSDWHTKRRPASVPNGETEAVPEPALECSTVPGACKPFAHLRAVIG